VSDAVQPDEGKSASDPVQPDSDKPAGHGTYSRKQGGLGKEEVGEGHADGQNEVKWGEGHCGGLTSLELKCWGLRETTVQWADGGEMKGQCWHIRRIMILGYDIHHLAVQYSGRHREHLTIECCTFDDFEMMGSQITVRYSG
jgi:hypothetical protein